MDKKKLHYKPAKIYNAGGNIKGQWFVYFSWRHSVEGKFQRIKVFADLNKKFKDKESRTAAAKILQQTINDALAGGWNPYQVSPGNSQRSVTPETTDEILRRTMELKVASLRPRTASTYKSRLELFLQWMKENTWHKLLIHQVTPLMMEQYQLHLVQKGYNPVTINNNIEIISALFKKLVKMKTIPDNPCSSIDYLRENESQAFQPYTDDELKKITSVLKQKHPQLFLFFLHIYYGYFRPETIVSLKAKNYDFKGRVILVDAEHHKNRKIAKKQMLGPLYEYLKKAGVHKLDPEQFVFSTNLEPGTVPIRPVRASELWREIIIEGEGINKKLYAAKSTGGIHYVNDNAGLENIQWLQKQMSHHSLEQTEIYIRKNRNTALDESKAKIRKL